MTRYQQEALRRPKKQKPQQPQPPATEAATYKQAISKSPAKKDINILGSEVSVEADAELESEEGTINIAALTGETTTTKEKQTETKEVGIGIRNAYVDAYRAVQALEKAKRKP